jgi:AcrR family transcriptional regulator
MVGAHSKPEKRQSNSKVTRDDWINLALRTLISDGVESVRIFSLGKKLKVSRSSFYWHFQDHEQLLDQLLEHWRNTNTKAIVERAGRPAASINRGILNVFECWADERIFNHRLDFAIREWARRSPKVHRAVDSADKQRVSAICDLFRRHGYGDDDAFIRARVLYYMQIGYYVLEVREANATKNSYTAAYLRSFSGREPEPEDVKDFVAFSEAAAHRKPTGGSRV